MSLAETAPIAARLVSLLGLGLGTLVQPLPL
jgi:hypothetical protein